MSEFLPILSGIKHEMETMNKSLTKMTKTHATLLSEQWITKDQVMAVLKISLRTLDSLKASRKLAFSKINGLIYFRSTDIEKLLNENYVDHSSINHSTTFNPKTND